MATPFRTFEDLDAVDDPGLQSLLRQIEGDQLATALAGASEYLRDRMLRNMAGRAAQSIREALAEIGVPPYREVDGAQGAVLARATQMVEIGLISLRAG